jgi:hypothetical protein
MHNQYVNSVRRAVGQGEKIVVDKVQLASPAPQLPNLELRELESAIARLSEEQRETLLLVTLEGLKYEQVAQVCDVPIGTVRSRLNRAREELRWMVEGKIAPPRSRHASRGEPTTFQDGAPQGRGTLSRGGDSAPSLHLILRSARRLRHWREPRHRGPIRC